MLNLKLPIKIIISRSKVVPPTSAVASPPVNENIISIRYPTNTNKA